MLRKEWVNMKRYSKILLTAASAVLIIMMICSVGVALTGCDETAVSDTQMESTTQAPDQEEKDLDLTQKSLLLSGDSEGILELYEEVWMLLSKYDTVKAMNQMALSKYIATHRDNLGEQADIVDGNVIIDLAADRDNQDVRYLAFLAVILEQCGDSVCYRDYIYTTSFNRMFFCVLFYTDEYQSKGYENAYDYLVAIDEDECEAPQDAYLIYFNRMLIEKFGDSSRTNLLDEVDK